jgi:hypothetical protein
MRYAVEMGSGAMIYIPSFTETGSAIQKLKGGFTYTQTAWRLHKPNFIFLNEECRLKRVIKILGSHESEPAPLWTRHLTYYMNTT